MRFPGRFVGKLTVVLALTCTPLEAAPITSYTGDGGDVVNAGAAVNLLPHPAWGDVSELAGLAAGTAEWISFVDSGYGSIVLPNAESRDLGDKTARFTRMFDRSSETTLQLWILADDTAIARLLGLGGYVNTLFNAYPGQTNGNVFGAQYAGTVESVPEPASLLLLGTGLGAVVIRRRLTASRGKSR